VKRIAPSNGACTRAPRDDIDPMTVVRED